MEILEKRIRSSVIIPKIVKTRIELIMIPDTLPMQCSAIVAKLGLHLRMRLVCRYRHVEMKMLTTTAT